MLAILVTILIRLLFRLTCVPCWVFQQNERMASSLRRGRVWKTEYG
jgi:hypothetical protein